MSSKMYTSPSLEKLTFETIIPFYESKDFMVEKLEDENGKTEWVIDFFSSNTYKLSGKLGVKIKNKGVCMDSFKEVKDFISFLKKYEPSLDTTLRMADLQTTNSYYSLIREYPNWTASIHTKHPLRANYKEWFNNKYSPNIKIYAYKHSLHKLEGHGKTKLEAIKNLEKKILELF